MTPQTYKKVPINEEEINWQDNKWHKTTTSENLFDSAFDQFSVIISLGWPNCIERFANFLPGFVILLFYGQLGPDNIAGAGLGFMFGNVTGLSIIVGFALGLSPLSSQAYGASNYQRCGDLLQKQISMHLIMILPPIIIIWLNCESILLALNQPPEISKLCGLFLFWRLPALPFFCISEDIISFLKSQRIFVPTMILMIILCFFTIIFGGFLILPKPYGIGLGFIGGPIALTCSNIIQTIYLIFKSKQLIMIPQTWPRWNYKIAFSHWGELLNLSLPSALMMWGEWWAWETTVFLAGLLCSDDAILPQAQTQDDAFLGNTTTNYTLNMNNNGNNGSNIDVENEESSCIHMEVLTIISNTMMLAYYFHSGYSHASGSHIGNLLGLGDYKGALMATRVCLMLVGMISLCIAILLLAIRHEWGKLFSDDPKVHNMVAHAIVVVSGYLVADAIGPGALKNILIVLGEVHLPAVITLGAFYFVGLPISVYLTFGPPKWHNIYGIWIGLLIGVFVMITGFSIILYKVDYAEKATSARKRALEIEDRSSGTVVIEEN